MLETNASGIKIGYTNRINCLIMDDKILKTEKLPEPKISLNFPEITPYVNATLYFVGGKPEGYSLQEFNIGFYQDIDYKGQPQHDEAGGYYAYNDYSSNRCCNRYMDGKLTFT